MTQCETILNHLRSGKPITPVAAFKLYGITTLSQRIGEITRKGMLNRGESVKRQMTEVVSGKRGTVARVMKYWM